MDAQQTWGLLGLEHKEDIRLQSTIVPQAVVLHRKACCSGREWASRGKALTVAAGAQDSVYAGWLAGGYTSIAFSHDGDRCVPAGSHMLVGGAYEACRLYAGSALIGIEEIEANSGILVKTVRRGAHGCRPLRCV